MKSFSKTDHRTTIIGLNLIKNLAAFARDARGESLYFEAIREEIDTLIANHTPHATYDWESTPFVAGNARPGLWE